MPATWTSTEMARQLGTSGLEGGLAFVVRSMTIGFEKPAYLDDMLVVETGVAEFGRVSMVFDQVIRRGEEVVCRMSVKVACIDIATKRIARIDQRLVDALS